MPRSTASEVYGDDLLPKPRTSSTCLDPWGGVSNTPNEQARVRPEAREFALRSRGSMHLWMDSAANKDYESPRPMPKCPSEESKAIYEKNQGSMGDVMYGGGHPTSSATGSSMPKKRMGPEEQQERSGGMSDLIAGRLPPSARPAPRISQNAAENAEKNRGSMQDVFTGGPLAAEQCAPRIKYDGGDNLAKNRGDELRKTMYMMPPSARP